MLRRALGLTQQEFAYLLGYRSHSQVARIEDGAKPPTFMEGLIIELVLGAPSIEIFPRLRQLAKVKLRARLRQATHKHRQLDAPARARFAYKAAQLERVTASLESREASELNEQPKWQGNATLLDWAERYL